MTPFFSKFDPLFKGPKLDQPNFFIYDIAYSVRHIPAQLQIFPLSNCERGVDQLSISFCLSAYPIASHIGSCRVMCK